MDICNQFDVDGQSSLLVTGIEGDYSDVEIADVFGANGEVSKIVRIPDELEHPKGRALIEYASDRSISRIDPIILGTLPSPKDPSLKWSVRTIRDVCQEEMGRELGRRYLSELKLVTGSGKAGFLSVLTSELLGNQDTTQNDNTPDNDNQSEPAEPIYVPNVPTSVPVSPVHIDENVINPPQIQRVIVEHVIRSDSRTSSPMPVRLRIFSGRMPKPNGEVDYDTWRTQVDLLLDDPSFSDTHKVRKILESLLNPATDVVKPLGISSPPSAYVTQLESAFGVVEDGEELFAAFLSSNQNHGEKPSAYLNRLHTLLTKTISRGGASVRNSNEHLLRQFCRGCWDQSIIIGLQLGPKKSNPPSFCEFLLMLRAEEDRRSAKLDRMKKHLGASKAIAQAHHIFDIPSYESGPAPSQTPKETEASKLEKKVNELTEQVEKLSKDSHNPIHDNRPAPNPKQGETFKLECKIAELTKQVEKLSQSQKESESTKRKECFAISENSRRPFRVPGMPRAWFCFKCGQDNHIAAHCSNEPNQTLVRSKNAELREARDKFSAQQTASAFGLNL